MIGSNINMRKAYKKWRHFLSRRLHFFFSSGVPLVDFSSESVSPL